MKISLKDLLTKNADIDIVAWFSEFADLEEGMNWYKNYNIKDFIEYFKEKSVFCHETHINWLKKEFNYKEENLEETYKIGDIIEIYSGGRYFIQSVFTPQDGESKKECVLASCDMTGRMWGEKFKVNDFDKITKKEIQRVVCWAFWMKIEKKS